jgi:hypothetical protein
MRVLTFAVLALFFACVAVGAAEVEAGKPTPAPKPPAAKPGVIAGVIADERGNVIRDAKVRIIISGISGSFGQRNDFTFEANEDGTYGFDIPDGVYKIWAEIDTEYNGRQYRLRLHPEDKKDWNAGHSTKSGVVKNFVWKVSGLKPGGDKKMFSSYYGPAVTIEDADHYDDAKKLLALYPRGKVVARFAPRGKLIDGSEIKPFEREFPVSAFQQYSGKIPDVPLGDYTVSAKLVDGNREVPLKIRWHRPGVVEKPPLAETAEIEFVQPSLVESLGEVKMHVGEPGAARAVGAAPVPPEAARKAAVAPVETKAAVAEAKGADVKAAEPQAADAKLVARPNLLVGKVVDSQGKPLAGAKVLADNTMFYNANLFAKTKEDGAYSLEVTRGSWQASATVRREYHGKEYTLLLHPSDPDPFAGTDGAVRNFELRLTGKRAGEGDRGFYGGTVIAYADVSDFELSAAMANVEVTLTPVGPLVDGSVGKPVTAKLARTADGDAVRDVPVGRYAVTARYARPNRKSTPMRVRLRNDGEFADKVVADFTDILGGGSGTYQMSIEVQRQPAGR